MRLPRVLLLLYAAPALPLSLLGLPLTVYLPTFWASSMHMPLAVVGGVLLAVRSLDVVFDPLIGRLSDRLRGRFGRRKPFIAAGLPIGIAGVTGLFFPPAGAGAPWLFAFSALVTLAWTMIALPYQAWGAELSDDYAERARITSLREGGTIVGILLSAGAPAVLGVVTPAGSLHILAALAVVLATPTILLMLARVPERVRPVAAPPVRLWAALRTAVANGPFRRLLAAWLVNGLANGLPAVLFLLMCSAVIRRPAAANPVLLAYFLAGILGVPLWMRLAIRFGKHRSWGVAMLLGAAAFAFVPLLGPGDVLPFLAISVGSGLAFGADMTVPPAIQADVIDLDELQSGEHRAGLFFAAWTMAQKAGNALAVGIAFPLLALAGFRTGGPNGPAQLGMLVSLYCGLPIVLKLMATMLVWRFPIDATEQARIRAAIAARA